MNKTTEFDSEFCSVRYIQSDNIVFLTWKKFARLEDYRTPTLFALGLLRQYPGSQFVVDAANGFEDDKADVEWGLTTLLPSMAQTTCRYVAFIMPQADELEAEMDLWTLAFGKYFAVVKATGYEQALRKIRNNLLISVRYTVKPGKRGEFFEKVTQQGIPAASKAEPGNVRYEYFLPVDSQDDLFLLEVWVSADAQAAHAKTEHYARLQALKQEYITATAIEKYSITA